MIGKDYLGDAVYAEDQGHGIMLTTEDGERVLMEIYLEHEVCAALERYFARVKADRKRILENG